MNQYIVKELLHFCNITPKRCSKLDNCTINFWDFTFVLKGSMEYIINEKRIVMYENDAILLPPATLRMRPAGNTGVHYVSYNFIPFDESILPTQLYLENVITPEIRYLVSLYAEKHISPFNHSHEKTANILNCVLYELIDSPALANTDKNVTAMLKYISDNLTRRITVDDVSSAVHLSRDYAAHLFKREIGHSIIDYVNERRMLLAKEMIQNREASLRDVAEALGFDSYSYFSRVFKRYFGESPISYTK